MALLGAIDLYCRFMWNLIFIGVTIVTCVATMRAGLKHLVIDVVQPEFSLLINPAQPPVLVTNQAVNLIVCLDGRDRPTDNHRYKHYKDYAA